MALTDDEKKALVSVASQLEDLASGLSGNRANELRRLAGLVSGVASGDDIAGVPLTLADQAATGLAGKSEDPEFTPAQPSAPAAQEQTTVDIPPAS